MNDNIEYITIARPDAGKSGGICGTFFIPRYQRGYRWSAHEVKSLLDDIWGIRNDSSPYSLQPIVVKRREDGRHELIDGQQRLTTLWLVLSYLKKNGIGAGPGYSLNYETRSGSQAYLETLDEERSRENIDYFHIYKAHKVIGDWFSSPEEDKPGKLTCIHHCLAEKVHVIWHEVSGEDPTALFSRLNQGRIPLTDAELIKAALLMAHERKAEVATQWDNIERDLQRAEVWAFIAPEKSASQQHDTRIGILFEIMVNEYVKKEPLSGQHATFHALQKQIIGNTDLTWEKVWKDAIALHAKIMGWLERPEIYNRIGFLTQSGKNIAEIFSEEKGQTQKAASMPP